MFYDKFYDLLNLNFKRDNAAFNSESEWMYTYMLQDCYC